MQKNDIFNLLLSLKMRYNAFKHKQTYSFFIFYNKENIFSTIIYETHVRTW